MASSNDPLFQSSKQFIQSNATQPKAPLGEIGPVDAIDTQTTDRNNLYASFAEVKGQDNLQEEQKPMTLANMSDEQLLEAMNQPLTGEEVAMKIAGLNEQGVEINRDTISLQEFEAYDEWRRKQTHSLWSAIGDGMIGVGQDVGKGLWSAATDWKKNALALGISAIATPAVGFGIAYGSTLLEAFARGTRMFGGLFVTAANHPGSPLYRMFVNPSGDVEQSYQDFLDLSQWNADSEKIFAGKTNALLPNRATYEKLFGKTFGDNIDDFLGVNHDLATAASYVLDPITLLTFGAGALGKGVATKAAAAALRSGEAGNQVAHGVAATAARNTFKANWLNSVGENAVKFSNALAKPFDASYKWITEKFSDILGTTVSANGTNTALRVSRVRPMASPTSLSHAVMGVAGITGVMTIPYGMGIASAYAGIKALGYAGELLAKRGAAGAATVGGKVAGSGVINTYLRGMGKSVGHGALYGGAIGYVTSGEEGLGHGIGMGIGLGASGHVIGQAYGSVSGAFAKQLVLREFGKTVDKLAKADGDLLKSNRMREFVERVRNDWGDDIALRTMAHMLGLEGAKNTGVAYMGYNDILAALHNDPNFFTEVSDINTKETRRVFTPLGEELARQLDKRVQVDAEGNLVQGQGWNGMFFHETGPDGKPVEKPYMIFKDGATGKRHVIINIDNLVLSRDAKGNPIMKTDVISPSETRTKVEGTMGEISGEINWTPAESKRRQRIIKEGKETENIALTDEEFSLSRARYLFTEYSSLIAERGLDFILNGTGPKAVEAKKAFDKLSPENQKLVREHLDNFSAEYKKRKESYKQKAGEQAKEAQELIKKQVEIMERLQKDGLNADQIRQHPEFLEAQRKAEDKTLESQKTGNKQSKVHEELAEETGQILDAIEFANEIHEKSPATREAFYKDRSSQLKDIGRQRLDKILKERGIMSEGGAFEGVSPFEKELGRKLTTKERGELDSLWKTHSELSSLEWQRKWREFRQKETKGLPKDIAEQLKSPDNLTDAQKARWVEFYPEHGAEVKASYDKILKFEERLRNKATDERIKNTKVTSTVTAKRTVSYQTGKTATTAPLGELWHVMNEIYREETHGQTIVGTVKNWLLGDENNKGVAFTDTKKAVEWMNDAYSRLVGPVGSDRALAWKEAINDFEKTGKLSKKSAAALDTFIEEIGERMFIEWEKGKPIDYILRGGDLGFARNLIMGVNEGMANLIFREGTNFGADINTKESFHKWFEQTKSGGKVRFDPIIQNAFKDLVRVYGEHGMKDRGTYSFNTGSMSSGNLASTVEQYGLEHRFERNAKGELELLSPEQYGQRQFERGNIMFDELLAEAEKLGPQVLDGLDIWVTHNDPKRDTGLGFRLLDRMSRESNQATTDSIAKQGEGFLFQSGDFSDIGKGLADLQKAQREGTKTKGVYVDRGFDLYGARGRPRTTPSGKMMVDLRRAREKGHTLIMRGIPTAEAYKIIAKHLPKTALNALHKLAPVIADGGHSMDNVISVLHNGFTQTDASGVTLDRTKGATITPRTTNFVPYDLELRVTLKNNRSPNPKEWAREHFVYLVKGYDIDALTRRGNEIWRDNPELQKSYAHINEFIADIHRTIDEYSGTSQIPATNFFGEGNLARRRRKYVVAAIGASPNKAYQTHEMFVSEGEWHASQFKNYNNQYNSPFMNLRMDNIMRFQTIDGERMRVRMNERVYYRSMVPTPKEGYGRMFERSYQSPDEGIPLNVENPMDYSESIGIPYSEDGVRGNVNNTKELIKLLDRMPQFKDDNTVMRFQSGDTWGATGEADAQFLKTNWKWAVEQGDIFLAESTKRFLAQFGPEVNIIRHTLEEHLNAGGTIQSYNGDIRTGKSVVFPVQHGTGSLEFLKDPTFRAEFLGKTTRADSAKMGYFFAGLQETANSYSGKARFWPFAGKIQGAVLSEVVRASISDAISTGQISEFVRKGKTPQEIKQLIKKQIEENKPTLGPSLIEEFVKSFDNEEAGRKFVNSEGLKKATDVLMKEYSRVVNDPLIDKYIDTLVNARDKKHDLYKVEEALGEGGYDFDSMLENFSLNDLRNDEALRQEAYSSLTDISGEEFSSYWNSEIIERTLWDKLDDGGKNPFRDEINRITNPDILSHRMMRSFVGFNNPFVYDFRGEGRSAGPRFGEIYAQAIANGHDGIILQNIHDRGPNDNIVSIPIGREKAIFVTDTSLSDKPAPRNSGYKEGGKYLHQAGDEALPAGAFSHNNPETVRLSRQFKEIAGLKHGDGRFIIRLNPDKSFKIGMEYDRMKHDPFNPLVRKAYEAFAEETLKQMQLIVDAGYRPEMHYAETEPYAGSREAIADIRDNKRLKVLATDLNFGDRKVSQKDINENPLLKMSQYKDAKGVPMRINDVFRFVHDFFGHGERGNGFGPLGEENAWDVHARMYSPLARRAMTSGTRGQNSWVNFVHQPNIEINNKREMARRLEREGRYQEAFALRQTIGQTRFADQKIGLMPEWTSKFDNEYTPIEQELYGSHKHAESTFGLYQAGDEAHSIHSPDAETFVKSALDAKAGRKFGSSVSIKSPAEYEGYTLLMAGEGRAHATISPDGELGGVIKGRNGTSEDVNALIDAAIKTGKVRWLNAFDTVLPSMYGEYGFEAVARMPFNDEYKPADWDYQLYGKFNGGRPDVIFMARTKDKANYELSRKSIPTVKEWDDGVALVNRKLEIAESAGDGRPNPLTFQDITGNTKQEIAFRKLMLDYADYVRNLDQQIKNGEVKQEQRMALLTRWHKQNKSEQTANSWSIMIDAEGRRVKVEEFTKEHLDGLVEKIVRNDSNFRKAEREALTVKQTEKSVAVQEIAEQILQQTEPEPVEAMPTDAAGVKKWNLNELKRKYRERFRERTIAYLQSISAEAGAKIMKGIDKTYEKREADRQGRLREEMDAKNAEMKAIERKRDQIELQFIKENEEARLNDQELPHPNILEAVNEELILWQAEKDKKLLSSIEDEVKALSPEEYETLADARKEKLGHASSVEVNEWRVQTPEEIRADMEQLNQLAYEGKLPPENEYSQWNGSKIWDDVEFREELDKRLEMNEQLRLLMERGDELKKTKKPKEEKPRLKAGSLEQLAKEKYANSQWFDSEGRSILREVKLPSGKKATIIGLPEKGNSITIKVEGIEDRVYAWEELPRNIKSEIENAGIEIYPEEYSKEIERVRASLDELRNKPIESQREKLLSIMALMELWGFEINPNLSDSNFVPNVTKSSMSHTEGMTPERAMREFLMQSGALFTSMEGPAIYGERLTRIPDLYDSTVSIISAITMGAEFTQVDKATGKIKAKSEIDLKHGEGEALVNEWKDDFLKQYPEWREFLVRKSTEEISSNRLKNAWKEVKRAYKEKHGGKLPSDAERAEMKAKIAEKLEATRVGNTETWIGNFFKKGDAESVEKRILDALEMKNELLKKKAEKSKEFVKLTPEQKELIKQGIEKELKAEEEKLRREGLEEQDIKKKIAKLRYEKESTTRRLSYSSDEAIAQEARKTAKDIQMAFIEWMFNRANEYIQEAAIEFQENQGYKTKNWTEMKTPEAVQAKRREALKKVEVEELNAEPSKPEPVQPAEKPKPVVQAAETPAVADYKKPAQTTQAPVTEKQRQAQALADAISKAEASGNVRQTGNLSSAIDKARAEQTPEKPRNLATAIAEAKAREEAERARRASQPTPPPPSVSKPPVTPTTPVNPPSQYRTPIGPTMPQQTGTTQYKNPIGPTMPEPVGSGQYDKPIGPRRPAGRPAKPVETSQVAKEQIADATKRNIDKNTVKPTEQVAQSHASVQDKGFLASLIMGDRAKVEEMLALKDHLTLKQIKKGTGFSFKSEDGRYVVNRKKSGSYEITMNSHISPYTGKPVDGKVVGIVPTLEHAQISIREFDTNLRMLVDQSGGNSSATHQATAPVMTPQQIDQTSTQLTQRAQQNPSAPVASPTTPAETSPHFNSAVDALRALGTDAKAAKERVKAAVEELGVDAQLNDIIKRALQKSQVVAKSIATANEMHAALRNVQTTPVNPNTVNQTTIMPTNAGVVQATGKSMPTIAAMPDSNTAPAPTPTIDKHYASIIQNLARFSVYQTKYKLLNGQVQTGKTYVNSSNYMISQTAPNMFKVTGPQGVYLAQVHSEEEGMDKILKHFNGNASNRP